LTTLDGASTSIEIQLRLSNAKHYNDWIYALLEPHLGQRILEAGCSIGNFTSRFLNRQRVVSVDVLPEALLHLRKTIGNAPNVRSLCMDLESDGFRDLAGEKLDTIVCLNVLEHIRDDSALLKKFWSLLEPGGKLLLFVPAMPVLYGSMDSADGHFRRYEKQGLSTLIRKVDFKLVECRYVNILGVARWFFNGRVLKRRLLPLKQLALFDRFLVPFARWFESRWDPPLGQSLFVVAAKPCLPSVTPRLHAPPLV